MRVERKKVLVFFVLAFIISSIIFAAITSEHNVTVAASSETDVWNGTSSSTNWTGSGTAVDPYIIDSCAKFKGFATNTISGTTYSGYTFKITKNLNFNGKAIGFNNFQGTLDGDGNTISNASFNGSGSTFSFCEAAANAIIKNIIFDSCSTLDNNGFIINTATNCTLVNCTVNANCSGGRAFIYSLYGGSVLSCINRATFNKTTCAGGMVSHASGNVTIKDCKNYGSIANNSDVDDSCGAGGIVGRYAGNGTLLIMRCINFGTVSGASTSTCRIGGILGQMRGSNGFVKIDKCINKGEIAGSADNAGGIIGVTASGAGDGGIHIYNCINLGNIPATFNWGGGLIGYAGTYCTVYGCAVGEFSIYLSSSARRGAFAGYTTYATGSVFRNCYSLHSSSFCVGTSKAKGTATCIWTVTSNVFRSSGTDYSVTKLYSHQESVIKSDEFVQFHGDIVKNINEDRGQYEICDWGICDDPEIGYSYAMPGYCTKDTVYADWTKGVDSGGSGKGPYGTDVQPVKSVQDAKWLCKKTTASTILAKSEFTVSGHDYWGFADKPNVTLKRTHGKVMVTFSGTGNLRVENLTMDGGAVWSGGTMDEILRRYKSNSGASSSGPIINVTSGCVLSLNDCTLQNNANANNNGGALSLYSCLCEIYNCNIMNNNAASGAVGGGGIYTELSTCKIKDTRIKGNYSGNSGGGMRINGGTVTIESGSELSNNNSSTGGGLCMGGGGTCTIKSSSVVKQNTAANGAGLYMYNGTLNFESSTLGDATNPNAASSTGGGLYINNGTCTMTSSSVNKNTAGNNGGGIVLKAGTLTVSNTNLNGCTCEPYGGSGLRLDGGTTTFTGGSIKNCTAVTVGAVYVAAGAEVTFDGTEISGNTSETGAGINVVGTVTAKNTTITNNTSTGAGGGVYVSGTLKIIGSTSITGNKKGTANNNMYLANGKVITLTGNLSGSGKIGISTAVAPTESTAVDVVDGTSLGTISEANKAYFTSDSTAYRILFNSDKKKLQLRLSPTWTVTIPAPVTSSTTSTTVNLSASLSGFGDSDNVDVKLTVPAGGIFNLTHPSDNSSVIKYKIKKNGTALSAGTQTVATFNKTTTSQALVYEITDTSGAKYAGGHQNTMTFAVSYRGT